jgi:AmmeMemoRadiSam system protein B
MLSKHISGIWLILVLTMLSACTSQKALFATQDDPLLSISSLEDGIVHRPENEDYLYPVDRTELENMLDAFLTAIEPLGERPIALVVPHGSYIMSGEVAAHGYKQLEGYDYDVAVIIGVDHFRPLAMPIAVWTTGAWETPLGKVQVDADLAQALVAADKRITANREVFSQEHPIETQIPFIQRTCPSCKIVPVIMGNEYKADIDALANALIELLPGRRAIIIASSDLSHFPTNEVAYEIDALTLEAIASLDAREIRATILEQMSSGIPNLTTSACGEGAVLVAIQAAKSLDANAGAVLAYTTSGELPGARKDWVTGFGTVVFYKNE